MPLMLDSHDILPYIDAQPSQAELEAATAILSSSLTPDANNTLHPFVPTSYSPEFSELISASHDQIASSGAARVPGTGIDLSRYEEPSAPTDSTDITAWRSALQAAYVSQSYLTERQLNLSLLERFGKNAWLIANSQIEAELASLEQDLDDVKRQVESVDEERRVRQEGVSGELDGLRQTWEQTVGRAVEAEMAGEVLRREIGARRRGGR